MRDELELLEREIRHEGEFRLKVQGPNQHDNKLIAWANRLAALRAELGGMALIAWVHPNDVTYAGLHRLYGHDSDPLLQRIPAGGVPVYAALSTPAKQEDGNGPTG